MSNIFARFLLDNSPWSSFFSTWMLGFCIVTADGQIAPTPAGLQFLDWIDAQ